MSLINVITFTFHYFLFLTKISKSIDPLIKKYKLTLTEKTKSAYKYLDLNKWIFENLLRVYKLNLHKQKSKKILDLGCGPGFFIYICNYFGHEVLGLDLKDHFYSELTNALGINVINKEISANKTLQLDSKEKFDLVTAFMICFDRDNSHNLWDTEKWRFFLNDIEKNILNDYGRIILAFNRDSNLERRQEVINLIRSNPTQILLTT